MDDLDRQLVQCLAADGRASFSAIAEVLGVSDQTVARRYKTRAFSRPGRFDDMIPGHFATFR